METAPSLDKAEYYRLLVEHSPDLLSRHSLDGAYLYASPACLRLMGYEQAELTGRSLFDLIQASDAERVRRSWNNASSNHEPQTVDYRIRAKDGRFVWFKTTYKVISNGAGPEVLFFSRNITDLKHIESALQILARGTNSLSIDDVFRPLVSHVTAVLRVKYAFITETSADKSRVRMLAFWKGADFGVPYEYHLRGTPCDNVINQGKICHYPLGVQAIFPDDADLVSLDAQGYIGIPITDSSGGVIGHLAILDDKPIRLDEIGMSMFKIFAARAGVELERVRQAKFRSEDR